MVWKCTLEQQFNSALTRFTDPLLDGIFDYNKLDKILNDKYKLKIVDRKISRMIKYNRIKLDELDRLVFICKIIYLLLQFHSSFYYNDI